MTLKPAPAKISTELKSWALNSGQVADLELLLSGALGPLTGFATRADAASTLASGRDTGGQVSPYPFMLDVSEEFASLVKLGDRVTLRHPEGMALAALTVSDIWRFDRKSLSRALYGDLSEEHLGVFETLRVMNPVMLGGQIERIVQAPKRAFAGLQASPEAFRARGDGKSLAMFVDWFPEAQQVKAYAEKLRRLDARPVVFVAVAGLTPDSRDEFAKVRTWSKVMARLGFDQASIVVVPVRPRRSPARDALMGAVIASNYGCTHYVWPGGIDSVLFSHEARELASSLGVQVVNALAQPSKNGNGAHNGTVAVSALRDGKRTVLTTFAEIAEDVKAVYPPAHMQGFTVFFTGLPASGKSTLANLLISRLMELDGRHVTLLDGDLVRKHLSSELGFSKEHRDLNITRIGFVASEINKNGGVAICAPIAPFRDARRQARNLVSRWGAFIEVHVSTPVEVCEARDPKGLYAKARAGQIRGFTGVDDPYDVPENPELRIDTSEVSADEGVEAVLQLLRDRGLIRAASQSANGAAHHP